MEFIPTKNITYKTKLNEAEIIGRLSDNIEPEKTVRFGAFNNSSTKAYEGQIVEQTFKIKRIISGRNSFLPIINGIIEKDTEGLSIKVNMRIHAQVIIFLCIVCAGTLGIGGFVFLMPLLTQNSAFNPITFVFFIAPIVLYASAIISFRNESNISKKDLQTIFQADIVEE